MFQVDRERSETGTVAGFTNELQGMIGIGVLSHLHEISKEVQCVLPVSAHEIGVIVLCVQIDTVTLKNPLCDNSHLSKHCMDV